MINKIRHTIVVLFILGNFSFASAAPPEVTRFTLSNGIQVVSLYVEDSTDVCIFSYLPLGLVTDGKAKTQWSHLIEHLVLRTTGPINNYVERNGQTTHHGMHLDFIGTTDNWKRGLELQTKWLSNSPLSETDLAEELPKALSELDFVTNNLHTGLFAMAAWNQVFRHGETDIAMRGAIESAELNELQAYRNRHLVHADRVLLCVIGGIEHETLQSTMEEQLGQIKLTANTLPSATTPAAEKNRSATWDVNVTHYIETYPIPDPTHKNYPAFFVANVLLNQALMMDSELKQLTGSIFSGVDLITPEQTYLYITTALKPDSDVEKVKQRIKHLINQLKQPENNWQVAMTAPALSQQFSAPMDIKMVMQQHKPAGMTETMMLGNLGLQWGLLEYQHGDTLPEFASALANVSADDVADVVNRYLTKDARMTLVLAPRDAFLDEFSAVNEVEIEQPEPPPTKPMPEASEADMAKAKEILAAAVAAHGGLEKLQAVKNIVMAGHTTANSPIGQIEDTSYYVYPDKFRQDLKMPQGETAYVFDGTSGFVLMPMGVQPIPPQMAATFKDAVFRESLWLLTNLSQNDIPIQYAGTEDVQGKPTSLLLIPQPSGEMMKLFVSEDTHYIVKIAYPDSSQGITVNRETLLSDYRDVDGVKVAYHAVQNVEGQLFSESRMTRITLNAELEESLFQEPK